VLVVRTCDRFAISVRASDYATSRTCVFALKIKCDRNRLARDTSVAKAREVQVVPLDSRIRWFSARQANPPRKSQSMVPLHGSPSRPGGSHVSVACRHTRLAPHGAGATLGPSSLRCYSRSRSDEGQSRGPSTPEMSIALRRARSMSSNQSGAFTAAAVAHNQESRSVNCGRCAPARALALDFLVAALRSQNEHARQRNRWRRYSVRTPRELAPSAASVPAALRRRTPP
jgi:hypothetical protein